MSQVFAALRECGGGVGVGRRVKESLACWCWDSNDENNRWWRFRVYACSSGVCVWVYCECMWLSQCMRKIMNQSLAILGICAVYFFFLLLCFFRFERGERGKSRTKAKNVYRQLVLPICIFGHDQGTHSLSISLAAWNVCVFVPVSFVPAYIRTYEDCHWRYSKQ